ncbi:hypothetical protein A3B85_01355 [Candidatus Nomurabacteria bacterium RIFCSPHIGHO2_02_FULL_37_13]|uniref:Uncharacterized protein n=1 Tax=Candidatus Nomurabacteria bacterium RIFCSPHIGHO2_02_FULL_37_13 TaxID=1801750 RepID=A0A1F6W6D1_9BACT|nr:MAG: hypothetical protein A2640_00445 [Candidatus Nomurabacteria bacterium RIFCSPHIGHO2_01_FULL_36_23]OGI77488.1 MAG: hypothetical protein A3B85_01355 [Candidatus Nomurabacteria bacterium RIFCSPHIGHO2_02_FULL_37_13]OGI87198.1 MAG: hypothetical protein A2906_02525 [Candidatus Nomurabacteria bacterium RIFCSPLOWO2_01_FULL_37_25]
MLYFCKFCSSEEGSMDREGSKFLDVLLWMILFVILVMARVVEKVFSTKLFVDDDTRHKKA